MVYNIYNSEENRIWNLIARKLSGEATAEELKELEDTRHQDSETNNYVEFLSSWWMMSEKANQEEINKAFQNHMERMHKTHMHNEPEKSNGLNTPEVLQSKPDFKKTRTYHFFRCLSAFKNHLKLTWRNFVKPQIRSLLQ